MVKHINQRVAVFIDVQNMYYSARNLFNAKVNFGNIVREAASGRNLVRALAYVVSTKGGEEKPFFEALEKAGIETKEKELQEFFGGAKKADWDVGIAVDMIKLAGKVDVLVLVSGDGDFESVVDYARNTFGCLVEVMAFGETLSSKLREAVDSVTDLSEHKDWSLIGPASRQGGPASRQAVTASKRVARVRDTENTETPKRKIGLRGRQRFSLKDL